MNTSQLSPGPDLANIDNGKAPKRRIGSARQAQELGQMLIRSNVSRSLKNARLKGQIDGNPPFNPAKLRNTAQSWRTNCNFGGAEASLSAASTPFYDLLNGAQYFAEIRTRFGSAQDQADYSLLLTETLDAMLRDSEEFDFNFQAAIFDMVGFGKGFLACLDPSQWWPEWVDHFLVYVPERTRAYTGKVPVLMLRINYELHELWGKIKDEKTAASAGWNVPAVKRAIESAYPPNPDGSPSGTYPQYEVIQQKLKEGELYEGYRSKVVQVLHFFVVEFDGKVSEYIVTEANYSGVNSGNISSNNTTDPEPQFLFERASKIKKLSDIFTPLFFELGDGKWHGQRGLAQKIFPIIEIQNRMFCSLIDNIFMRSGISLQANTAEAVQKLNLIQIGPFNIIPPGFMVQPSTIMGDLNGALEGDRALEQKLTETTGIYKPRVDKPIGNPRTAAEVRMDHERSVTLSNTAVSRFYRNCDRLFQMIWPRISTTKEFKDRLIEAGMPEEIIPKAIAGVYKIRAYRAIGNGNATTRRLSLEQMAPLVPMMTEAGKVAWLRDSVAAIANREAVQRYAPTVDQELPTDDQSIALIENAALKIGCPVTWTPTQNNVIHAQTHLGAAASAAESIQQGGHPIEVLHFIDAIGQHVLQHLQRLQSDPSRKTVFNLLKSQWEKLAKFADELRAQIEHAKEQADQQPQARPNGQPSPEDQALLKKTQADIAMKAAKNQQLLQQKDQKFRQQMGQSEAKFHQELARKDATTAADIMRQQAKHDAAAEVQGVGK